MNENEIILRAILNNNKKIKILMDENEELIKEVFCYGNYPVLDKED